MAPKQWPSSYDRWETLGANGWNYHTLLPFLKRTENAPGRDRMVRGCTGPMVIEQHPEPNLLSRAWFEAALEAGHLMSSDGNGAVAEGVSWTDSNIVNGRRQSAADAYLRPVLGNLTVITNAHVSKLVFEGMRCRGAEYSCDGLDKYVEVGDEVVLAAGTIGSAQLLMLSGIGRAEHLSAHGIEVRLDAPDVGRNLHDRPMCWITYSGGDPLPWPNGIPHILLRSSASRDPDLQIGFSLVVFGPRWTIRPESGFSVTFSLMSPASRGSVQLSGRGPQDPLLIDPAYFAVAEDLDLMVTGMRRAHQIASAKVLSRWRGPVLAPDIDMEDDAACRAYIRTTASTYFHPVGTCRMGSDPLAVVDSHLRVRGVEGLRVADASVMPTIISANTNATVLAIAERAATLIDR